MEQNKAIPLDYHRVFQSVLIDESQAPYIENFLLNGGGPCCEVIHSSSECQDEAARITFFWYNMYVDVFTKHRYSMSYPKIALLNSYTSVCKIHITVKQIPIIVISKGTIGEILFNAKRITDFMMFRNRFFEFGHHPTIHSNYADDNLREQNYKYFFKKQPQEIHEIYCSSVAWALFLIRIFHEIDHWMSGHLFFTNMYKNDIDHLEAGERLALFRALEYDADSFIASESINYILNSPSIPTFATGIRRSSKSVQIEFLQQCFIASFQHPTVSDKVPQDGSGSHDPFRWRSFSLIKTLPEAYRIRSDFEGYELSVQQSAEAFRLMYDLAGFPLPEDVHIQSDIDAYNVSIGKTMSIWSAIRPYLVPLKKGSGNLAKAQAVPDPKFVGWIAK